MSQQPGRNDPCPCGSGRKFKKCCEGNATARTPVPKAELNQLVALFHAGRHEELESRANLLLKRYPDLGIAWKILGTALGIQGKHALPALQKAARLLPNDAEVQNNLGNALKDLGQFEAALGHYRNALVLSPQYVDAYINMGVSLSALGQHDQAIASYRQALAFKPDDAEAHNNLGVALKGVGQIEAAVASYRQALTLNPVYPEAFSNLGNALQALGQYDAAVASYRQGLELKPDYTDAHNNLGIALKGLGQIGEAVASYSHALVLKPDFAEAYYNLGIALYELGQIDDAVNAYKNAVKYKPSYDDAYINLGNCLKDIGQFEAALSSYRRAQELQPENVETLGSILFTLNYTASHATAACLNEARVYGQMVSKQVAERFATWACATEPERLRVGLMSGDLRNHPVAYALESLLEQLDPARLEMIAYPTSPKVDALTTRIQPYFSAWKPIYDKSDAEAASTIHADGIHILLDLSGHTAHNRLPVFAWKPAPVQASWLGYFATTGVAEMDYLLTSEVAVPPEHQDHFTEHVWYLPDIWLCFTPPRQELPINPLPALTNGYPTFGCFQRLDKISDVTLSAWGKTLAALPKARLLIANKQLGNETVAAQFTQRLQQHGIDPARIELQGSAKSREDYLARYGEVDIMLDTFPYPGVTTTCEALWMGVPTLTLAGDTLLSRQGAGMLVPAGLSDWVAYSEEGYVEKAIQLTSDLPKLAALRAGLRQQVLASPVYDAPRFARNFEAALWGMWRNIS